MLPWCLARSSDIIFPPYLRSRLANVFSNVQERAMTRRLCPSSPPANACTFSSARLFLAGRVMILRLLRGTLGHEPPWCRITSARRVQSSSSATGTRNDHRRCRFRRHRRRLYDRCHLCPCPRRYLLPLTEGAMVQMLRDTCKGQRQLSSRNHRRHRRRCRLRRW